MAWPTAKTIQAMTNWLKLLARPPMTRASAMTAAEPMTKGLRRPILSDSQPDPVNRRIDTGAEYRESRLARAPASAGE